MRTSCFAILLLVAATCISAVTPAAEPLQVYILAGQSNMQGHAHVSTLSHVGLDPKTSPLLSEIVDDEGIPRVHPDVWITSIGNTDGENELHGRLTTGFGAGDRGDKFGPELTFGIEMKKAINRPILIIKTAWGGKSLHTDFRSPGAGGYRFNDGERQRLESQGKDVDDQQHQRTAASGLYYHRMIDHVEHVLRDIARIDPLYDAQAGYEVAGFVWFQGWNDMVDQGVYPARGQPGGYDAYSRLMAQFIRDVRAELKTPKLPFVIGVLGVGGPVNDYPPSEQRYAATHDGFRKAMAAPASMPEFKGNVAAVLTENFWDAELSALKTRGDQVGVKSKELQNDLALSPEQRSAALAAFREQLYTPQELEVLKGSSNAEYHYLGSAKIMAQIGRGFAAAMIDLQSNPGSSDN